MSIVVRGDAASREIIEQLRGLPVELDHPLGELVAHARLNQHGVLAGANEQRVESGADIVLFVGLYLARPHYLGHNAEKRAAIERVNAIRKNREFEVAKREPVHLASVPQQKREPRICADFHGSNRSVFFAFLIPVNPWPALLY